MTKFTILFLLIFYHSSLFSQYVVLDKTTKQPIENVSVDYLNGDGTFTNNKGEFTIGKDEIIDSIKVSCVGYKGLVFKVNKKTSIYLERDIQNIDEVLIKNKTKKILKFKVNKSLNIFKSISVTQLVSNGVGITYLPFPDFIKPETEVKITKIIVSVDDYSYKERSYWPFKVNLYKIHKPNLPPILRDSLLTGIITQRKKGAKNKVYIDIKDKNISLPKKGIYVSFETLADNYYPDGSGLTKEYREFNKQYEGKSVRHTLVGYGAVAKAIKINLKNSTSFSYAIDKNRIKNKNRISPYWEQKKNLIYDLTIEIEY